MGSGKVSVQTAYGTAASAQDFIFVPPPYRVADVTLAARASFNTNYSTVFTRSGQAAIFIFDGTAGQKVRILANAVGGDNYVSVYNPDGTVLVSDYPGGTRGKVMETPTLPTSGTYTVLLKGSVMKVVLGTPSIQLGEANLVITTDIPPAGDFSLSVAPEYYQNHWQSPAFVVYGSFGANPAGTAIVPTVSGLPSGVTASFAYNFDTAIRNCEPVVCTPIPGASARLSFTIPGSVAAGSYPFTITGTMGSVVHTVNATLEVRPIPAPWLETDILTTGRGEYNGGAFSLYAVGGGNLFYTDAQHLVYQSLSGDGSIVTRVTAMSNKPNSQGAGRSYTGVAIRETLTDTSAVFLLRLNNTWPSAAWSAEVQTRTTTAGALTTTAGPVVAAPYWLRVARQGNNFTAFVSADGINWQQVGATTSISMAANAYIGLVGAADNFEGPVKVTHDNVSVTTAPDFTLTGTPASQGAVPGASAAYTVNVGAQGGFSGTVNLSLSGLPANTTAGFTPSSITGTGTSTLNVQTTASTPLGTYPLTITGTSGALTRTTTVTLATAPDFTVGVTPATQTVNVSSTAPYTVNVQFLNGLGGPVTLSATGVPQGASSSFSPSSMTASGNSTLTIVTGPNTPPRTYNIVIVARSGSCGSKVRMSCLSKVEMSS